MRAELLKHLRSLNFILVLVSMIILLTVTTNVNFDVDTAISQLEEIMASLKNWDESFLQKYCTSTTDPNEFFTGHNIDISFQYNGAQYVINNVYIDVWSQDDKIFKKIKRPETLNEFEVIWNNLANNIKLDLPRNSNKAILCRWGKSSPSIPDPYDPGRYTITGQWTIFCETERLPCEVKIKDVTDHQDMHDGEQFQVVKFPLTTKGLLHADCVPTVNNMIRDTSISEDAIYALVLDLLTSKPEFPRYDVKWADANNPYKEYFGAYLTIPFTTDPQTINGQKALNSQLGQKWRKGRYEYTFKQLNELTKNDKDASLISNWKDINNKRYQKNLKFELFGGIEIPSHYVGTWGLLILLSVQIYFLCHLRVLYCNCKLKNKTELNFPWIGIYPDYLAKLTYLFSAILLPISTNILVAIRTSELGILNVYGWIFFVLSIITGIVTFIFTTKIWCLPVVPAGDISVR